MLTTVRFGSNQPPKPQMQPQAQPTPQPVPGQAIQNQEAPKQDAATAAEAEVAQESAALPVPDFAQEPQGNICPFKSAVNLNNPGEGSAADGTTQKTQMPRVHRNGCYYRKRPDGKFEYDDINYYNAQKGRQFTKGDVLDLDNVDAQKTNTDNGGTSK